MSDIPTPEDQLAQAQSDHRAGRLDAAIEGYRQLLRDFPDNAELHANMGAALKANGDTVAAETSLRRSLALDDGSLASHYNLANLLRQSERFDEALGHYHQAQDLASDNVQVLNNLGATLYDLNEIEAAIAVYRQALDHDPYDAEVLNNLGNALQRLGRLGEAEQQLRAAVAAAPDDATLRLNLGGALQVQGRYDEAMTSYDDALALNPGHVKTRLKRGTLMALRGDWTNGFAEYMWRWKDASDAPRPPLSGLKRWDGGRLDGDGILLWSEQGYGDAIHLCRYAPLLVARGGRPVLAVPQALMPVMRVLSGVDVVANPAQARTPLSFEASLMDLPHLFGSTPDDLPNEVPYLAAEDAAVKRWSRRLAPSTAGPRIGIVWAGNPAQPHDYTRSIDYALFRELFDITGVDFVSLQVGADEVARARLVEDGVDDLSPDLADFGETAAAMSALDLVISVDSAPAHLAGALGRSVWILLSFDPDCRWLLSRRESPWYPSARLFRQPSPGDWRGVMHSLREALPQFVETLR